MKTQSFLRTIALALLLLCSFYAQSPVLAEVTAFTYQGRLNTAAGPANGLYDFTFTIFDLPTGNGGFAVETNLATQVSNGLFTVTVDFGPVVTESIFSGPARWLEIAARTNGPGGYTTLTPRQQLTATPYAVTAANVSGGLSGTFSNAVNFNNPANSFSGNGGGLTNVNATTLGGFGYCALPCYWNLGGNAGTTPGLNFVGTTDNQPLELKVNYTTALELVPGLSLPNVVGGRAAFRPSVLATGVSGVVIAGGNAPSGAFSGGGGGDFMAAYDDDGTIGGGFGNKVGTDNGDTTDAAFATVGGGIFNSAGNFAATVGGGSANTASGAASVVAGGNGNVATADYSSIGGGGNNTNLATYSVIAGGTNNRVLALGNNGFVGAGANNTAGSGNTVVAGGANNIADGNAAAVGGGSENHAGADHSYVGGGQGNASSAAYAFVGGGANNHATTNYAVVSGGLANQARAFGAVVGGGGYDGVLTAGNVASGPAAVVSGGIENISQNSYATIGGGVGNASIGYAASIGGGWFNYGGGQYATIGGGQSNTAAGAYCTVPGGFSNLAFGQYSFAAGQQAQALHAGSFVWADSLNTNFASTAGDQFSVRALGGVRLVTGSAAVTVNGALNVNSTNGFDQSSVGTFSIDSAGVAGGRFRVQVNGNVGIGTNNPGAKFVVVPSSVAPPAYCDGLSWFSGSDRNAKEGFVGINPREVLEKVAAMPITEWRYKGQPDIEHVGPMAQDFHEAFGLNGADDKHISTVDEGGVALAAIQGLNQKLEKELEEKENRISELETRLAALEKLVGDRQ